MSEIMVRQWSFCLKCGGNGCEECNGKGTTVELIPLASLPKGNVGHPGIREEYAKAQADFIREQEVE